jgi:hypothetical protein
MDSLTRLGRASNYFTGFHFNFEFFKMASFWVRLNPVHLRGILFTENLAPAWWQNSGGAALLAPFYVETAPAEFYFSLDAELSEENSP